MFWVALIGVIFFMFLSFVAGILIGTVYGPEIADGLIRAMRYIGLGE